VLLGHINSYRHDINTYRHGINTPYPHPSSKRPPPKKFLVYCVNDFVATGVDMKQSLYGNIQAKRERIKEGSGEKMRKPGTKGAPTAAAFKASAKTAKKGK
jgi:hypothetical protein